MANLLILGTLFLLCQLLPFGSGKTASAQDVETEEATPVVKTIEAGIIYAWYNADLGHGDYEFLKFVMEKENKYVWQTEAGRAARFGDSGFGFGTSLDCYFQERLRLAFGFGAGSGDAVFPEYRFDVLVGWAFLAEKNLLFSLGYIREQSREENYFDGFTAEMEYYMNEHWIAGVFGRYDVGYPGRRISTSGGVELTYEIEKKMSLGAVFRTGEVSYLLITPERELVDYNSTSYKLIFSRYLTARMGINSETEYEHNSHFDMFAISLSVFREW